MLSSLWFVVAIQALVIVGGTVMYLRRHKVPERASESVQREANDLWEVLDGHANQIQAQQKVIEDLMLAVAEGIENVARSERRVRSTVQRAQKRLAEAGIVDEGIEAEAEGLPERDAEERGQLTLPDLPDAVEDTENSWAVALNAIPGRV